ncbi:hypothetical protein D9758_009698 [Tetrapyrgos nigripes]|uniref:Enoyl reductase (ER) domain-containing protein n=1 Tax=Tetrapyrgos nigripes TaxID=182062 RepID=A0A8H5FQA0_9AGAR|nr:hypothetical protein D9758_009698 [Tetrapyrgos nigripes]
MSLLSFIMKNINDKRFASFCQRSLLAPPQKEASAYKSSKSVQDMSKTHTAIATTSIGNFDVIQVPTGKAGDGQVLLKHEYAAMIPFDTYVNDFGYITPKFHMIFGFSAAGTIVEVGSGVDDLKVGDRVTAFTYGESQFKGAQEYSVQPRHIPDSLSLEEACTIPDNFITAFGSLFNPIYLALPIPSSFPAPTAPPLAHTPILVLWRWFELRTLLNAAGYDNVIVTASSKHHEYLRSLGAKHTLDYRSPNLAKEVGDIVTSSKGKSDGKIDLVLDCISTETTLGAIGKFISPLGKLAILLPVKEGDNVRGDEKMYIDPSQFPEKMQDLIPKETTLYGVRTFLYAENEYLRTKLMPRILPELLETGIIKPNKIRLIDESSGSLKDRVGTGLDLLRNNQISGEKVVVKVGDITAAIFLYQTKESRTVACHWSRFKLQGMLILWRNKQQLNCKTCGLGNFLTFFSFDMLSTNGIECWIGKRSDPSPSAEIPHAVPKTRLEDDVTVIEATIKLKSSTAGVALDWQELNWRKAGDADPQSYWCVVRWTSGAGKEKIIHKTWMSRSHMETQTRSTRDLQQAHNHQRSFPVIKALKSTNHLGVIRLELQRIKGDIRFKRKSSKDVIDIVLEDEKPFLVFEFRFEMLNSDSEGPKKSKKSQRKIQSQQQITKSDRTPSPSRRHKLQVSQPSPKQSKQLEPQALTAESQSKNPLNLDLNDADADGDPDDMIMDSGVDRSASEVPAAGLSISHSPLSNMHPSSADPSHDGPDELGTDSLATNANSKAIDLRFQTLLRATASMNGPSSTELAIDRVAQAEIEEHFAYPNAVISPSESLALVSMHDSGSQVPVQKRTFSQAISLLTQAGVHAGDRADLKMMVADLNPHVRELQEVELLLRQKQREQLRLDAELIELTKACTASLKEQVDTLEGQNERKRKWLQFVKDQTQF